MRHLSLLFFLILISVLPVFAIAAQDEETGLLTLDIALTNEINLYGQSVPTVRGLVINPTENAYANIAITAQGYTDDNALIAEGFGVLVDACGAGLLPDFVLEPDHSQNFLVPLELFEAETEINRVEVQVIGEPVEFSSSPVELPAAITQISDDEVVAVEWNTPRSLRYATGCLRDLFHQWTWHSYNSMTGRSQIIEHPRAAFVTDTLRERLGLQDDLIFANSFLRFAPVGTRLIYQDAVNRFYTANEDGRFQRLLYTRLNNRSLQGVQWLDGDRFIATYYGAYGDEVLYFTADAEARPISPGPLDNPPSVITPGATQDARRVVLAGTFENVTGYYLHVVTNGFFELLFEAEPPGNNYPAPIPLVDAESDLVSRVYVARDSNGVPTLQCFNRDESRLYSLASLPLRLDIGERAWFFPSPDERTLALAATGVNGGLWLIDLTVLPSCGA